MKKILSLAFAAALALPLMARAAVLAVRGMGNALPAEFARKGTAFSIKLKTSSAFITLLDSVPAHQREGINGNVASAPIQAAPAALAAAAIPPGKDIAPKFSDPVRVGVILKLVSDVYYGKPLQFPKDGTVFDNREGLLPAKPAGYYREYTVLPPPGSPMTVSIGGRTFAISPPQGTRGAERLIIGGGEVLYYSPDHYRTFIQLQVLR